MAASTRSEWIAPSDIGEREELWAAIALLSSPEKMALGQGGHDGKDDSRDDRAPSTSPMRQAVSPQSPIRPPLLESPQSTQETIELHKSPKRRRRSREGSQKRRRSSSSSDSSSTDSQCRPTSGFLGDLSGAAPVSQNEAINTDQPPSLTASPSKRGPSLSHPPLDDIISLVDQENLDTNLHVAGIDSSQSELPDLDAPFFIPGPFETEIPSHRNEFRASPSRSPSALPSLTSDRGRSGALPTHVQSPQHASQIQSLPAKVNAPSPGENTHHEVTALEIPTEVKDASNGGRVLRKRELRQKQPYTYEMAHYKSIMRRNGNDDAIIITHRLRNPSLDGHSENHSSTSSSSESEPRRPSARPLASGKYDSTRGQENLSPHSSLADSRYSPNRSISAPIHFSDHGGSPLAPLPYNGSYGNRTERNDSPARVRSIAAKIVLSVSSDSSDSQPGSDGSPERTVIDQDEPDSPINKGVGPIDSRRFRKALQRTLPRVAHAKVYEEMQNKKYRRSAEATRGKQIESQDHVGLAKRIKGVNKGPLNFQHFHDSSNSADSSDEEIPDSWLDHHPWRPSEATIFANKPSWPQLSTRNAQEPDPIDYMLSKAGNAPRIPSKRTKSHQRRDSGRVTVGPSRDYPRQERIPRSHSNTTLSSHKSHSLEKFFSKVAGARTKPHKDLSAADQGPQPRIREHFEVSAKDPWATIRKPGSNIAKLFAEYQKIIMDSDLSFLRSGRLFDLLNRVRRLPGLAPHGHPALQTSNLETNHSALTQDDSSYDTRLEHIAQGFANILESIRSSNLSAVTDTWRSVIFILQTWQISIGALEANMRANMIEQELNNMELSLQAEGLLLDPCAVWHVWFAIEALVMCQASVAVLRSQLIRLIERLQHHDLSSGTHQASSLLPLWPVVIHMARVMQYNIFTHKTSDTASVTDVVNLQTRLSGIFADLRELSFTSACALVSVHGNWVTESSVDPNDSWKCLDEIFGRMSRLLEEDTPRTLLGLRRRSQYLECTVQVYRIAIRTFRWRGGWRSFRRIHDALEKPNTQTIIKCNRGAMNWLDTMSEEVMSGQVDRSEVFESAYYLFLRFIISTSQQELSLGDSDLHLVIRSLNRLLPTRRFTTAANEIPLLIYNYSLIMVYITQSTSSIDLESKFQHIASLVAYKQADTYTRQICTQAIRNLGGIILIRRESLRCIAKWANIVTSDLLDKSSNTDGLASTRCSNDRSRSLEIMLVLRTLATITRLCPEGRKISTIELLDDCACFKIMHFSD